MTQQPLVLFPTSVFRSGLQLISVTTEGGVLCLGTGSLPRLYDAHAFAGIHKRPGGRTPKPQGNSMPVSSCGDCYTQQRGLMNKHPVRCSPAVRPGQGTDWVTLGAQLVQQGFRIRCLQPLTHRRSFAACQLEQQLILKINLSHGFSRDNRCAPDTSKGEVLYQSSNPISIQYDSRLIKIVKKKRELFLGQRLTSPCSLTLP
jgi:hypothetical protein